MLAALLLACASPWLAYSRAYFRETTIGLAMVLAMCALAADRPIWSGLGAACIAVLKPAMAFIGACFAFDQFRDGRRRDAIKTAMVLVVPALAYLVASLLLQHTVVKSGLRQLLSPRHRFDPLLDPQHGIVTFVPWALIGLIGSFRASLSLSSDRLLRYMALPLAFNLVVSSGVPSGYCFGPRYWVPFLPWLAVGTIRSIQQAGIATRLVFVLMVLVSVSIAIPSALCYPKIFDKTPIEVWHMFVSWPV